MRFPRRIIGSANPTTGIGWRQPVLVALRKWSMEDWHWLLVLSSVMFLVLATGESTGWHGVFMAVLDRVVQRSTAGPILSIHNGLTGNQRFGGLLLPCQAGEVKRRHLLSGSGIDQVRGVLEELPDLFGLPHADGSEDVQLYP